MFGFRRLFGDNSGNMTVLRVKGYYKIESNISRPFALDTEKFVTLIKQNKDNTKNTQTVETNSA